MVNKDEKYICEIIRSIPGIEGKYASREEDCGHQKADVKAFYKGETYYFQVSHTPKSKKEQAKLLARGTIPISTHKFEGVAIPREELEEKIKKHIQYE